MSGCDSDLNASSLNSVGSFDVNEWLTREYSSTRLWNFFHIPKAAGTSLSGALDQAARKCGAKVCHLTPRQGPHGFHLGECSNSDAALVSGHQFWGDVHSRSTTKRVYFTMLRHPLSRIPSLYKYIRVATRHKLNRIVRKMTLTQFAKSGLQSNDVAKRLCDATRGPNRTVCDSNVTFAAMQSKWHLFEDFAVVGLQECYSESLRMISSTVPWIHKAGGLREVRANVKRGGSRKLTDEESRAILENNSADVEVYEFGQLLFRASMSRQPHGSGRL